MSTTFNVNVGNVNFPNYFDQKGRKALFDFFDGFFIKELKQSKVSQSTITAQAESGKMSGDNSSYDSSKLKCFFGDAFVTTEDPSLRKVILDEEFESLNVPNILKAQTIRQIPRGPIILQLNTDQLKNFAGDDLSKLMAEYVTYVDFLANHLDMLTHSLLKELLVPLLKRADLLTKQQLSTLTVASSKIIQEQPDSLEDLIPKATQYPDGDAAVKLLRREDFTQNQFPILVKAIVEKAIDKSDVDNTPSTPGPGTMGALLWKENLKEFIGDDELFGKLLQKVLSLIEQKPGSYFAQYFIQNKQLWNLPESRATLNKLIDHAIKNPGSDLVSPLFRNKDLTDLTDLAGDRLQTLMNKVIDKAIQRPRYCQIACELIVRDDIKVLAGSRFDEFKAAMLGEAIENPSHPVASAIRRSKKVKEICADRYDDFMKTTVREANNSREILKELFALDEGLDWLNKTISPKKQEPLNKILDKSFCNLDEGVHYSLGFWLDRLFKAIVPNEINTPEWRSKFLNDHCPEAIRGKIQVGLQCPLAMAS